MPRDHWDFKSHVEDLERIFEQPPDEFLDDYYKPDLFGTADGVTPELHAWRRTVEIRPILPPDPPKFIRVWNERANKLTLDDGDYGDA